MKYLPRIVDAELDLRLRSVGATVLVGPKWCGKTTAQRGTVPRGLLKLHEICGFEFCA